MPLYAPIVSIICPQFPRREDLDASPIS